MRKKKAKPKNKANVKTWKTWLRLGVLLFILVNIAWISYRLWYINKADQYTDFSDNMAISVQNGKYGYVNEKLKLVINHQFDNAWAFKDGYAIVGIRMGNNFVYRLINKQGRYIGEYYDSISYLGEGLYKVQNKKEVQGLEQLMNTQGQIISKRPYYIVYPFTDGRAQVCNQRECGFIDTQGNEIVPLGQALTSSRENKYSEGLALVKNNAGLIGYANIQGQIVIPHQFIDAKNFSDGFAVVRTMQGLGVIDKTGAFTIKPSKAYQKIEPFSQKRAVFIQESYYGVLDPTGRIIVPTQRQYIFISRFKEGTAYFKKVTNKQELVGFIDTEGKEIIPAIYERAGVFENGVVWVMLPNATEMLYLNKENKVVGKNKLLVTSR